jgi:hypothetical protein
MKINIYQHLSLDKKSNNKKKLSKLSRSQLKMNSNCRFQEYFLNLRNQKLIDHLRISMQFQLNMLNNQLRKSKLRKKERKKSRGNSN